MATVRERGAWRARIRLSVFIGTAALALGLIASGASAAFQPIGSTDNAYTGGSGDPLNPTFTMDQGDRPTFADGGVNLHNVQSRQNGPDGGALFFTPTLSGGTQVTLDGTQYLSAGTYAFFCTIHPTEMQGTLVVTNNGIPEARPSVALEVRTKKISKALRKGIVVAITPSPGPGITMQSLVAKLGKTTIGKAKFPSTGPHSPTNVIQLSKAGKSKLRKKGSAKVTIKAHVLFGFPTTTTAKLK
jgi:plastocyanin